MGFPPSKSSHDVELQRTPQRKGRYGVKAGVVVLIVFICMLVVTRLSIAIESSMGQEVTGIFSIFATPTTDLHLEKCPARVPSQQAYLFQKNTYSEFFKKTHVPNVVVDSDLDICEQGFHGNSNSYGLGVRWGQYSLWLATFIATQAQLSAANMLLHATIAYQLFNIANIVVMTFSRSCVFSVEVMVVLFLSMGGNSLSLRTPQILGDAVKPRWTGISLARVLFHITSFIITLYQAWYWIWGFYGNFVEMPCGAFDFLGLPANHFRFRFWRIYMGLFSILSATWSLVSILCSVTLFFGEFKRSVLESQLYTKIHSGHYHDPKDDQTVQQMGTNSCSDTTYPGWYRRLREHFAFLRSGLFESFVVSRHTGKLINWVSIGTVKLACIVIAAAVAENTLKVNKVSGVQSLNSNGQCLALASGVCGLLACIYSYMRSEADHPLPKNETNCKPYEIV